MSNRTARVNELIQRELSAILRRAYQHEAAAISIISVTISPDLHDGKVFVAITGDEADEREKLRWLEANAKKLRHHLAQKISLKTVPLLTYEIDTATARGNRILNILAEIEQNTPPAADKPPSKS